LLSISTIPGGAHLSGPLLTLTRLFKDAPGARQGVIHIGVPVDGLEILSIVIYFHHTTLTLIIPSVVLAPRNIYSGGRE
jgi:hypothetical protein